MFSYLKWQQTNVFVLCYSRRHQQAAARAAQLAQLAQLSINCARA